MTGRLSTCQGRRQPAQGREGRIVKLLHDEKDPLQIIFLQWQAHGHGITASGGSPGVPWKSVPSPGLAEDQGPVLTWEANSRSTVGHERPLLNRDGSTPWTEARAVHGLG